VTLEDAAGHVLATARTPAMPAPADLVPRLAKVNLTVPAGASGPLRVKVSAPWPEVTLRATSSTSSRKRRRPMKRVLAWAGLVGAALAGVALVGVEAGRAGGGAANRLAF
jgi:hypothetical protein